MVTEFTLLAMIAAIAFFAGFIHSAIGFGFGIVAIALLQQKRGWNGFSGTREVRTGNW